MPPVDSAPVAVACRGVRRVCRGSALATLPTPLERGPELPGGARLWVKRDDLTGLGVRRQQGAQAGVPVRRGAGRRRPLARHGRRRAVEPLPDDRRRRRRARPRGPPRAVGRPTGSDSTGNQLLSALFGAQLHFVGCPDHHWGELEIAREQLTDELAADGAAPYSIPIGGSTATGALGYVVAYVELLDQCAAAGIAPAAIVHTSSSGGTHAGLVAGRALLRARGAATLPDGARDRRRQGRRSPGVPDIAALAGDALALIGVGRRRSPTTTSRSTTAGSATTTPCRRRPATRRSAGRRATAAGCSTARTPARASPACSATPPPAGGGRGDDVVFVHTGGLPAVFADGGAIAASTRMTSVTAVEP